MLDQATYADTHSAISSPESAYGPAHFDKQHGLTIDLFGPVPVLANLSARQAKELRLMTSGTFGPHFSTSLASAALQSSLESRLRARMQSLGSTLYKLTWKAWDTGSGRSRSRLRASVLRTSETGSTGWPTPTTRDWKDGAECANVPLNSLLGRVAWLAGWPTPQTSDSTGGGQAKRAMGETRHGSNLNDFALLAGSGETPNGSPAETGSIGQLNPAHSRWLMGLPPEWDGCAPTATPSTRKRQQPSSDQPTKQ
jgi:hypothetical protein